jgi:hypothetical protein
MNSGVRACTHRYTVTWSTSMPALGQQLFDIAIAQAAAQLPAAPRPRTPCPSASQFAAESIDQAVSGQAEPEEQVSVRGIVDVDPIGQTSFQGVGNVGSVCTANDRERLGLRKNGHEGLTFKTTLADVLYADSQWCGTGEAAARAARSDPDEKSVVGMQVRGAARLTRCWDRTLRSWISAISLGYASVGPSTTCPALWTTTSRPPALARIFAIAASTDPWSVVPLARCRTPAVHLGRGRGPARDPRCCR